MPQPTAWDGPCTPWTLPDLCCDCAADATQQEIDDATAQAISDVFVATCKRFSGCCRVEVRPCAPACYCYCGYCEPCGQYVTMDLWEALCTDRVNQVVDVLVDGVSAPSSMWRLDADHWTGEGRTLVLTEPPPNATSQVLCWPAQDRQLANGQPGTWSVIADIGADPPADVLRATADLACEYIKLCVAPDTCNLNDGVSSLTRRGTTINFADLQDGNTGVRTLDRVLAKYACETVDHTGMWNPCPDWSFIRVSRPSLCSP